jgi:uncharacterized protein (DUF1697 family)
LQQLTVYLGLLRAVNVGGQGKVAMADLRRMAQDLGFSDVRTFLQSGNLIFRSDPRPTRELEARLETAARGRLGLTTDFIVRTATEWAAAQARNPFPQEARDDPAHLVTVFLRGTPSTGSEHRLQAAVRGPERVRVVESHAYIVYPNGIARSRLTLPVVEEHLGFRGTGRNWNTVTKLAALSSE